ncbi:MAG: FHA domain-containing protein [Mariniblastus sp.]|nr:FHA domain-containing protein [Mariniblastus sp.]
MLEAKLVVVGGEAKQAEVRLKTLPATIGRAREATLTLPHPLVSRKHCEIFEENGQLYVKDLDSLNGTYVNNERIAGQQPLGPEQLLTLGNVTFRAVYQPVGTPEVESAEVESAGEASEVSAVELPAAGQVDELENGAADTPVVMPAAILPDEPVDSEADPLAPVFEPVESDQPAVEPVASQRDIATTHGARSASQNTVHEKPQPGRPEKGLKAPSASDTGEIDLGELLGSEEVESGDASDILIADEELAEGPQQSISDSAIANLPGAQSPSEFSGDFAIQDTEKAAVEQVEAVEIDLGDEDGKRPDESSSQLKSFVRKLPR